MPATFQIQIKIDSSGAASGSRAAVSELDKIEKKALDVNKSLRSIFGVYAIKEVVEAVYGVSDAYTALRNKLAVVATDQSNLNAVMNGTFEVAQRTRSSWESTATMYQRLSNSTKTLGVSQKELLHFQELLNKEVIVSGATSMEARQGLIQLSQGMASGTLRGQDLRAILEDLPGVADVIGKHFGVTGMQLRQLGKDGKITGAEIFKAFMEDGDAIELAFGKTLPTLAQSFEVLRNAAIQFFGDAGSGSGVLQGLAAAVKFVAENFDTFGKIALGVGEALIAMLVIDKIVVAVNSLTAAIAANPLGALLIALTIGVSLLRQFGDQISLGIPVWTNVSGVFVTMGDALRVIWNELKEAGAAIADFVGSAWKDLIGAFDGGLPTDGVGNSLETVLMLFMTWFYTIKDVMTHLKDFLILVFGGIPAILAEKFASAFDAIVNGIQAVMNNVIGFINKMLNTAKGIQAVMNISQQKGDIADANRLIEKNIELQGRISALKAMQGPGGSAYSAEIKALDAQRVANSQQSGELLATAQARADQYTPISYVPNVNFGMSEKVIHEAADAARSGFQEFSDRVGTELDGLSAKFHDEATKRIASQKTDGVIGTDKTKPGAALPDPAAGRAAAALERQLEGLLKKSNQVRAAQESLREFQAILDKPGVSGEGGMLERLFGVSAGTLVDDYTQKLKKAADPLGVLISKTVDETAAMQGNTLEYEHKKKLLEDVKALNEKGAQLSQVEISQLEKVNTENETRLRIFTQEKTILDAVQSPMQKYNEQLEALANVRERLTAIQYADQHRAITEGVEASKDADYKKFQDRQGKIDPLGAGWNDARDKVVADMENVAGKFSDLLMKMYTNLTDFITTSAETGTMAWDKLLTGIEHGLNELALRIIEKWLLMKAFGIVSGAGSVGNDNAPSVPGVNAPVTSPHDLYGGNHATGGSYRVPGTGGPDSQNVMFRLTPGELVHFIPPGNSNSASIPEYPTTTVPTTTSGPIKTREVRPSIHIHNFQDNRDLLAVLDTPEGRTTVANVIRKIGRV